MDEFEDLEYPELELETDDLKVIISIKKDYSAIKNIDERKKEFVKDLKDFIDEFNEAPESKEFMKYYDD